MRESSALGESVDSIGSSHTPLLSKRSRTRKPPSLALDVVAATTAAAPVPEVSAVAEIPTIDEFQDVASMCDEDLMKLCQEGDEGAFEVLFQRYEGQVLSFIQRMIGDSSRVEAVGQEAFLRIFKDAKGYQYPRSFTTWFYTIVRNLCKNDLRWRSRHPTLSIEEGAGSGNSNASEDSLRLGDSLQARRDDPLETMIDREMCQKLQEALAELDEQDREILILSRFQNLKYKEISEIVGLSVNSVRARMCATLEQLKKSIKDYL